MIPLSHDIDFILAIHDFNLIDLNFY